MNKPSNQTAGPAKSYFLPWSAATGLVVVLALYFGAQIIGQILLSFFPALRGGSDTQQQFVYVLVIETLTIALLYLFLRHHKVGFRHLGLLRPRLRDAGWALLAYPSYFVVNAAFTLAAAALLNLNLDQQQQTGFEAAISHPELVLTFISLVVLPPIVEEIVMRGFLFGSLKKSMSVVTAAIITSIIFAVAHLQFGSGAPLLWVAAIDTFILSLVLCYLRQKTGSLWAGIGLHAIKNGLAFMVIFILKDV